MRRALLLCGAVSLTVVLASAQSSPFSSQPNSSLFMAGKSSANEFHVDFGGSDSASLPYSSSALPEAAGASGAAASGAGMAAGQEQPHGWRRIASHGFAADLGAGFNAPIGNDTSTGGGGPFITYGGNFTVGGGLRFSKRISLLGEFQFLDNKLPGALIGEVGAQTGNAHIISITAAPVIDLFPKATNSVYLTGGGGYYHKSTNFNVVQCCDIYGYGVPVTVDSFSSNQLGGNLGLGISRRLGGVNGDGTMKLFAEGRYLYINTPRITETNGLGRTELIPVTLGVRW
ncbi:MAG: hypothetical protein ABR905_05125 [Terracidiphilus sp.]